MDTFKRFFRAQCIGSQDYANERESNSSSESNIDHDQDNKTNDIELQEIEDVNKEGGQINQEYASQTTIDFQENVGSTRDVESASDLVNNIHSFQKIKDFKSKQNQLQVIEVRKYTSGYEQIRKLYWENLEKKISDRILEAINKDRANKFDIEFDDKFDRKKWAIEFDLGNLAKEDSKCESLYDEDACYDAAITEWTLCHSKGKRTWVKVGHPIYLRFRSLKSNHIEEDEWSDDDFNDNDNDDDFNDNDDGDWS